MYNPQKEKRPIGEILLLPKNMRDSLNQTFKV